MEYPCEIGNLDKQKKVVNCLEEHVAHALTASKGSYFTRLRASRVPIHLCIGEDARLLHSIYVDAKRWGISWLYPTSADIPNIVKWGLDIISSEYDSLEADEIKASSSTPQEVGPTKTTKSR